MPGGLWCVSRESQIGYTGGEIQTFSFAEAAGLRFTLAILRRVDKQSHICIAGHTVFTHQTLYTVSFQLLYLCTHYGIDSLFCFSIL